MKIKEKPIVNLFWMRRDLRLDDNTALFHALKTRENVLPMFIFDSIILDQLEERPDRRVSFIYKTVVEIKKELEKIGSTLYIAHGKPVDVFKKMVEEYHICSVYANRDYEPYAITRDEAVGKLFKNNKIEFVTYKDHVIFEKNELTKSDGTPYTVFTPYQKRFMEKLNQEMLRPLRTSQYSHHFYRAKPLPMPLLSTLGFEPVEIDFPSKSLSQVLLEKYAIDRDFPAKEGTSKLSVHLRFGTVSIRRVTALALLSSQVFVNELIWRNFYSQILW